MGSGALKEEPKPRLLLDFLSRIQRSRGSVLRDVGEMKETAVLLLVSALKLRLAAQRCLCKQKSTKNK